MTTQPPPITPGDKELTARVTADLLSLPTEMNRIESLLTDLRLELDSARTALKDAQLDAKINAVPGGKNEDERKLKTEKAVAADPRCAELRAKLADLETTQANAESGQKELARRFQAALYLCDLQTAKINFLARAGKPAGNGHKEP